MTLTTRETRLSLAPGPRSARFQSEAELVDHLVKRMKAQWPLRAVGFEVKSHGRARTDVCVAVRDLHAPPPNVLVGVEAKLTSWQRALRQAMLNRFCVDLSMIALPSHAVTPSVIDACREEGVGLLAVDRKSLHVVMAARIAKPDATLRQKALDQLTMMRPRGTDPVSMLRREV